MTTRPAETAALHTRLMKCALEVEDARAYWSQHAIARSSPQASAPTQTTAQRAFEDYWFGAKSLARVKVLLTNFRARFDAIPQALHVLAHWPASAMDPETRTLICHWHLQFADPLYRAFTGTYLPERRSRSRASTTRELVITWVANQGPGRWTIPSRVQLASKLLSCAYTAGLVATNRDPRPVTVPRVRDDALVYLMYLLRGIEFDGSLDANPYLASVGFDRAYLEERLAALPAELGLAFERQGDLRNIGWAYPDLQSWGTAMFQHSAPSQQPAAAAAVHSTGLHP